MLVVCANARGGGAETEVADTDVKSPAILLRVTVTDGAQCQFSYSDNGTTFTSLGAEFTATAGRWVGAKVGLFAVAPAAGAKSGLPSDLSAKALATAEASAKEGPADFDWFRVGAL